MLVIGVDGGTTKTIALAADEGGHIRGARRGPGSNCTTADVEGPMQVVAEAARAALSGAGVAAAEVAVFGLAGADWPEDYERRRAVLERAGLARRVVVKNDAVIGMRAGTHGAFGVGIVAGTGTNTCVVAPDGREYLYGYYARRGGALDIADEAIDAVLRSEDGRGPPTTLTGTVLRQLGHPDPDALLRDLIAGRLDRTKALPLCPLVFVAADAGDRVATEIVIRQGQLLAEYVTAAIRRFDMQGLEFPVVLAGGVFKAQGPLLLDTIAQVIHAVAPRARLVRPGHEPAVGAVLLAYDTLGIPVGEDIETALARTAPTSSFFDTARGAEDGTPWDPAITGGRQT